MTTAKTIAGIIPGLQATALVAANIPKDFGLKPKKPKKPLKRMVKLGITNIAGIGLIKATATEINKL